MMPSEKNDAWLTAWPLVFFSRLVKNETVIGIIGNTHGVSNANNPCSNANQMNPNSPRFFKLMARFSSAPLDVGGGGFVMIPATAGVAVGEGKASGVGDADAA